ncbi:lysylphosphatidylglycerol synthase domain-containing protein [soil metagenome]
MTSLSLASISNSSWWPHVKRLLTIAFFVAVAALLFVNARAVDWPAVFTAMKGYGPRTLAITLALTVVGYLVYALFDVLAKIYTQHTVGYGAAMVVSFVSYAFNMSLGALVGSVGFRYRLYSRLGLTADTITRIITLGLISNWIGYMLLAGVMFALGLVELPAAWHVGSGALRAGGVVSLLLALAWIGACFFSPRRSWTVKGHEITLPDKRMTLAQLSLSIINWVGMAAIPWVLLDGKLDVADAIGIFLVGGIAGVVAHVPAGLGVTEAVYIAMIGDRIPRSELLAALLTYRTVFYLIPLAIAVVIYVVLELANRRRAG